jgi:tetratricopeptide (TPR) repeat protein
MLFQSLFTSSKHTVNEFIRKHPQEYIEYYLRGALLLKKGKADSALFFLKKINGISSDKHVKYKMAVAYQLKKDYVTALDFCDQAILLDKHYQNAINKKIELLSSLAYYYFKRGNYLATHQWVDQILQLKNVNTILCLKMHAYLNEGKIEKAWEVFTKFLYKNELLKTKVDAGLDHFNAVLSLTPLDERSLEFKVILLLILKNFEALASTLDQLKTAHPQNALGQCITDHFNALTHLNSSEYLAFLAAFKNSIFQREAENDLSA